METFAKVEAGWLGGTDLAIVQVATHELHSKLWVWASPQSCRASTQKVPPGEMWATYRPCCPTKVLFASPRSQAEYDERAGTSKDRGSTEEEMGEG
jgi:hypothetical protein